LFQLLLQFGHKCFTIDNVATLDVFHALLDFRPRFFEPNLMLGLLLCHELERRSDHCFGGHELTALQLGLDEGGLVGIKENIHRLPPGIEEDECIVTA
jgi:hypothetical protein